MDNKTQIDAILLDFAKAFDKVPHLRLLSKLTSYGITGNIENWIKSFLSNRKQRVSFNGALSDITDVTSGVPHGSVLGPVLFLLYIDGNIKPSIRFFADDRFIYRKISSKTDHEILQTDLSQLQAWSDKWQMEFNVSKCVHLIGVKLDSKLTWTNHVTDISSKSSKTLGMIKRTIGPCKPEVKQTAYNMLIRPKLEYSSPIWNPHTFSQVNSLERVQHCAARSVKNYYRRNTNQTYPITVLGWPTLERRRIIKQATTLYKILKNIIEITPHLQAY